MRGPSIVVLRGSNLLDEFDRKNKLTDPVELKPGEELRSLADLAKLYPPPVIEEDIK